MKINLIALFIAATYSLTLNIYAVQKVWVINNTNDTIDFTWWHKDESTRTIHSIAPGSTGKELSKKGTDIYKLAVNGKESVWLDNGMAGRYNSLLWAIIKITPSTMPGATYHYTVYHINKAKLGGVITLDALVGILDTLLIAGYVAGVATTAPFSLQRQFMKPVFIKGISLRPMDFLQKVKYGAEGDLE